jgi:hypothetical protein
MNNMMLGKQYPYKSHSLYIAVNSDLNLTQDAINGHTEYIVSAMIDRIIENIHITVHRDVKEYENYKQWIIDMYEIIILNISEIEIIQLMDEEDYAILYNDKDAGTLKTDLPQMIGIFPRTGLDHKMLKYKN